MSFAWKCYKKLKKACFVTMEPNFLRIQYTKFSSFSFSLGFDLCLKQSHCMLMVHVVAIRV
ncbi:hypothetical protein BZG16_30970 [Escherichia coli]|nr:hypothetical protein [Escherichia coli]